LAVGGFILYGDGGKVEIELIQHPGKAHIHHGGIVLFLYHFVRAGAITIDIDNLPVVPCFGYGMKVWHKSYLGSGA